MGCAGTSEAIIAPVAPLCRAKVTFRAILEFRVKRALFERSSIMSSIEEAIRSRAYELWEHAGRPEGRSEEFWHAARAELDVKETIEEKLDSLGPPIVEPPAFAVRHGIPVGMPGERIVEQGVDDEGLENLLAPHSSGEGDG